MSLRPDNYIDRLIDKKVQGYLSVFGAVSIEGPKWCGKTWTSLNNANSVVFLDDSETRAKADLDLELILNDDKPELIDEWNLVPQVWDAVRRKCDQTQDKGNYILTCSTKLSDSEQSTKINHSGAGRIGKIKMYPMSLYESRDSTGEASVSSMIAGRQKSVRVNRPSLEKIAELIVRGGWPSNINNSGDMIGIIPSGYIQSILDKDINDGRRRDRNRMEMLLKSLARNESTVVSNNTLLSDIETSSNGASIESRITIDDYLDALYRLNITEFQPAYSENYRSPNRVGKSPKRHFVDPSLACASLGLSPKMLVDDLKTFGFMFESLVERDLRIYADYLGGKLYHFRDNVSGMEIDSIIEFASGDYVAMEIKLGFNQFDEAKQNLVRFANSMTKKPIAMCVIVGYGDVVARDLETGVYVAPITALKP